MLSEYRIVPLLFGMISAYFIILVFDMLVNDFNHALFILIGGIFLSISLYTKIAMGIFNKRIYLIKDPNGYWFTIGNYLGFIVYGVFF